MKFSGKIDGLDHTTGSGIVTIRILSRDGDFINIHADAGPFFRNVPVSKVRIGAPIHGEADDMGLASWIKFEEED